MNNLKESWKNVDVITGNPGVGIVSPERFISGRSQSLHQQVRSMFVRDFIIKGIGALFITINIMVYNNDIQVRTLNAILLIFLLLFTLLAIRHYSEYRRVSDPGKAPRENLFSLLGYLERRFTITAMFRAATYLFGFVPGLMLYFYLAYGYMKPMVPLSWFVFSFLCLLGMISGFILDTRQVAYHISHIRICLSDVDKEALALACDNIESKRKLDHARVLSAVVIILLVFLISIVFLVEVNR